VASFEKFQEGDGVTPRGYWGVVCARRSRASDNAAFGENEVDQLMREIEAEEEVEESEVGVREICGF
jgi:hypothetical protein